MTLDLNLRVIRTNTEVSGPSVLLIHGFASSGELNWERARWTNYFTDHGRNVLLVDLPGHGAEPHRNEGSWAPSQIRQALAAIVIDLDEGPVDVLGYSLGSRLAWEFAAWNPDLVEHLVMGGPGANDMLAGFEIEQARKFLASGEEINDDLTASIMQIVTSEPSNDAEAKPRFLQPPRFWSPATTTTWPPRCPSCAACSRTQVPATKCCGWPGATTRTPSRAASSRKRPWSSWAHSQKRDLDFCPGTA